MTKQGDIVLVTGATGNTGGAVVDALVRRDVPVRAMVRTLFGARGGAGPQAVNAGALGLDSRQIIQCEP